MAEIRLSVLVPAAPAVVWEELRHIDRHVEWMSDAVEIRFVTEATEGVGARFDCLTRVGPLRTTDRMEVTEWVEGELMGIRHAGLVSGWGRFRLTPRSGPAGEAHTEFEWTEMLRFRWWMGGPVAAALAAPVLRSVWRRNLRSLAARFPQS